MIKLLIGSISLVALSIYTKMTATTGCRKDTISVTQTDTIYKCTPKIQGLWVGTYNVNGQSGLGNQYLSLTIKPDGTMINDSKAAGVQHLAIGTWTLTGDTVLVTNATAIYGGASNIGINQTHSAVFNKTTGILSVGTWNNNSGPAGSGTFTLIKVN